MRTIFQNIKTKRTGLGCKIRVMNHSGDDILTTYALDNQESVTVAQADLDEFMESCIAEFKGKVKPKVFGRSVDSIDFDLLDIQAPDFDLSLYNEILIQPVPLSGG